MQEREMEERLRAHANAVQPAVELERARAQNADLKRQLFALQQELYSARLATKYLDKELAGRYLLLHFGPSIPPPLRLHTPSSFLYARHSTPGKRYTIKH